MKIKALLLVSAFAIIGVGAIKTEATGIVLLPDNPNLTVGENIIAQANDIAAHPIELARADTLTITPPTVATIGVSVPAMPTNAPPTPGNFLQTVIGYFSSTTDLQTFQTNDAFDIWTGAEYVNNLNTAATLGISWNAWQTSVVGFGLETQTRNAGIAGTILSQGMGFNIQKVYKDIKLEAFVEGEKNFKLNVWDAEVGVRIFKALTDNTFAGIGISEFIGGGGTSTVPNVLVFAGAKF